MSSEELLAAILKELREDRCSCVGRTQCGACEMADDFERWYTPKVTSDSPEKDRLLRCFLNAAAGGSIPTRGVRMLAHELVGRCPFCAHKTESIDIKECPECERAIW